MPKQKRTRPAATHGKNANGQDGVKKPLVEPHIETPTIASLLERMGELAEHINKDRAGPPKDLIFTYEMVIDIMKVWVIPKAKEIDAGSEFIAQLEVQLIGYQNDLARLQDEKHQMHVSILERFDALQKVVTSALEDKSPHERFEAYTHAIAVIDSIIEQADLFNLGPELSKDDMSGQIKNQRDICLKARMEIIDSAFVQDTEAPPKRNTNRPKPFNEEATIRIITQAIETEKRDTALTGGSCEFYVRIRPSSYNNTAVIFALVEVRAQPDATKTRIAKKITKAIEKTVSKADRKEVADRIPDILKDKNERSSFFKVHDPVMQVDFLLFDTGEELVPKEIRDRFVARAMKDKVYAQGTKKAGILGFTNIILEQRISKGQVGPITTDLDLTRSALSHGPCYVIVDTDRYKINYRSEVNASEISGALDYRVNINGDAHIAYVVPDDNTKQMVVAAVADAYYKGIIARNIAVKALSKLVTYQEFTDAPTGVFEHAGILAYVKRKEAEGVLEEAMHVREDVTIPDGLPIPLSPLQRAGQYISAVFQGAKDRIEEAFK